MISSAKQGIKEAYSSEEYALIQAINAYLETSKSYNLAYERLTEWYGIYYPEIRVQSPKMLSDLAIAMNEGTFDQDDIKKIVNNESLAKTIVEKSKGSIGRKMNPEEKKTVLEFAQLMRSLSTVLDSMEGYIKIAADRMLPNTTYLTDEKIAAELLAKAGSMDRLATMPASTIQLLGAEKSLFKHLKFGSKPPKYGVLFKMAVVNGAPRDQRGRIARIYATKISIALKADHYTKNFIAKDLKKQLDQIVERIKKSPPRESRPHERPNKPHHGKPQYGKPQHGRQHDRPHHGGGHFRHDRKQGGRRR